MNDNLERGIRELTRKDPRYAFQAYCFLFEALEHTVRAMSERRHVTGQELSAGIRELALQQFGGLARMVLGGWGIFRTEDFGEMVFHLVDAGLMGKTESDSKEDFRGVYDFEEAFPILAPPRREAQA